MPKDQLYQGPLFVKKSPINGYGVFAAKDLAAGEIIEECHTLFTSIDNPVLSNYFFNFEEKSALPLGYGCIYNHSNTPNIEYHYDPDEQLTIFTALRQISQGEELCSSYGENWFESRKLKVRAAPWWRRVFFSSIKLPLRAALVYCGILALIHGLRRLSLL